MATIVKRNIFEGYNSLVDEFVVFVSQLCTVNIGSRFSGLQILEFWMPHLSEKQKPI